jgi:hypothetical protein
VGRSSTRTNGCGLLSVTRLARTSEVSMMAPDRFDEPNGGRYPSRQTLELLRAAFARYLGGDRDDERVCEALAILAREAQDRRLHAEHMLVAFKRVWNDMPELMAVRDVDERKRLLDHLVKLCIDAYYGR